MPKFVKLSTGLEFKSVMAGVEHFLKLLAAQDLKVAFTGVDEVHIRAAYNEYCVKTDWQTPSPIATFEPVHDRGPGYTTRCFGVTYVDGSTAKFSMKKALSVIATGT